MAAKSPRGVGVKASKQEGALLASDAGEIVCESYLVSFHAEWTQRMRWLIYDREAARTRAPPTGESSLPSGHCLVRLHLLICF